MDGCLIVAFYVPLLWMTVALMAWQLYSRRKEPLTLDAAAFGAASELLCADSVAKVPARWQKQAITESKQPDL